MYSVWEITPVVHIDHILHIDYILHIAWSSMRKNFPVAQMAPGKFFIEDGKCLYANPSKECPGTEHHCL